MVTIIEALELAGWNVSKAVNREQGLALGQLFFGFHANNRPTATHTWGVASYSKNHRRQAPSSRLALLRRVLRRVARACHPVTRPPPLHKCLYFSEAPNACVCVKRRRFLAARARRVCRRGHAPRLAASCSSSSLHQRGGACHQQPLSLPLSAALVPALCVRSARRRLLAWAFGAGCWLIAAEGRPFLEIHTPSLPQKQQQERRASSKEGVVVSRRRPLAHVAPLTRRRRGALSSFRSRVSINQSSQDHRFA